MLLNLPVKPSKAPEASDCLISGKWCELLSIGVCALLNRHTRCDSLDVFEHEKYVHESSTVQLQVYSLSLVCAVLAQRVHLNNEKYKQSGSSFMDTPLARDGDWFRLGV